jgi:beta-galactosidase
MPCVTKNKFGQGTAYYLGTQPEDAFLSDLLQTICADTGLSGLYSAELGVEITRRIGEKGATVFVLNHNAAEAQADFGRAVLENRLTGERMTGKQTIPGRDVWILRPIEQEGEA